jgi:hypothetical protein
MRRHFKLSFSQQASKSREVTYPTALLQMMSPAEGSREDDMNLLHKELLQAAASPTLFLLRPHHDQHGLIGYLAMFR